MLVTMLSLTQILNIVRSKCGGKECRKSSYLIRMYRVNIWSLLAPIKEYEVSIDKNKITNFDLIKAHMLHHEYNIFGISET